ncbi:MAG: hypothetical protein ABFD89_07600 [Bryobacteraceae bacterium]
MVPRIQLPVLLTICLFAALPAFSQQVISAQSGLVHYTEGDVFLADKAIEAKASEFPQMKEGEQLRTELGRAEVLLTPGVFLRAAENTSFKMLSTRLTAARLEFLSGSMVIEAAQFESGQSVAILHKDSVINLTKGGLFRFNSAPGELRVFEGSAVVEVGGQKVTVSKGRMLPLNGTFATAKFDRELTDALDNWSARRAEYLSMANVYAARSVRDSGTSWLSSGWMWNPYFGMMTYIPMSGIYNSPYGYSYWSPSSVISAYQNPPLLSDGSSVGPGYIGASSGGVRTGGGTISTGGGTTGGTSAGTSGMGSAGSSAGHSGGMTAGAARGSSAAGDGGGGSRRDR